MSGGRESYCWLADKKFFHDRGSDWHWLTDNHIKWVLRQHSIGSPNGVIAMMFEDRFGKPIHSATINRIIGEGGLPPFADIGTRRCPNCGGLVVSQPCVLCSVNKSIQILKKK